MSRRLIHILTIVMGLLFALCIMGSAQHLFGQTTGAPLPFVQPSFFSTNGNSPCGGCLLYTYAAGTTTNQTTYTDSTNATPNANPIVLSSIGRPSGSNGIYLSAVSYKFVLKTAAGATVWTQDNVYDFGQLIAAGLIVITSVNNREYCVTGANFGTKFTAAAALLPSTGGIVDCSNLQGAQSLLTDVFTTQTKPLTVIMPTGTASSAGSLTIPANITLEFPQGGVLSMASATTATINGHIQGTMSTHFAGSGAVVNGTTSQPMHAEWWGAIADNSTDSAPAITAASTAAGQRGLVVVNPGRYVIGSTVTIKSDDQTVTMEGAVLRPTFTGVAIRVGEDSANHSRITLQGGRIERSAISWTPGNTALQVSRVYNSHFIGQSIYGFEKGIQLTTPTAAETDQNYFNFKSISNTKYPIYIYPTTSGAVNANVFTGGGQIQYTVGDPNYGAVYNIASSTLATPISTTTAIAHNLTTGATVIIAGHTINTNANGTWIVTVTGATTFTLNNSVGNGVGGATGTVDTGSYGVMMSKQNDANGNVNSNVFDNIYIATSNGGAVPPANGLYINGAQNDFTQLHTEGFPTPTAVLGPDAGGVGATTAKNPNTFWGLNADWLTAEDNLAVQLYPHAQYTFSGRDGVSIANGGNANSTYVLRAVQTGASTKDTLQVLDSTYAKAFVTDANGKLTVTNPNSGAFISLFANSSGLYDVLEAGGTTALPLRIKVAGVDRVEIATDGDVRVLGAASTLGTVAGTYASLPAVGMQEGDCRAVTDSNTGVFLANIAGGGANHVIACWDNTGGVWRAH